MIVKGREKSKCVLPSTCIFKYATISPTVSITNPKTSYMAGDIITLSGTGFVANSQPPVVTLGGKTATINDHSPTQIIFVFPEL